MRSGVSPDRDRRRRWSGRLALERPQELAGGEGARRDGLDRHPTDGRLEEGVGRCGDTVQASEQHDLPVEVVHLGGPGVAEQALPRRAPPPGRRRQPGATVPSRPRRRASNSASPVQRQPRGAEARLALGAGLRRQRTGGVAAQVGARGLDGVLEVAEELGPLPREDVRLGPRRERRAGQVGGYPGVDLVDAVRPTTSSRNSQAEEDVGLWKYSAEPDGGDTRSAIDTTGDTGRLTDDVEGVALFDSGDGKGFLVVSNQGENDYAVYRREGDNEFVGFVHVVANAAAGIDGASETDGLDVSSAKLGSTFPGGLMVVQDGRNIAPEERQNFKYVSWTDVAAVLGID